MIVLTVDDSDVNLAIYRCVLSALHDVRVVSYTSPVAALAWARDNTLDVVIVDYHMPELDGIAFIERFRARADVAHSLIVMVTADEERDVRHRALAAGANDFLTKPVDRVELTARMRNLLEIATSRRELSNRAEWLRKDVERATAELVDRESETIVRLTRAAEFRDEVTGMHVIRVGHMCAALGRALGLPDEQCRTLLLAAPMHDIGKVATPDGILLKPGPLTAGEFEIMKLHTIAGHDILKGSRSPMLQCAAEIALTHHERFDGSGYPAGLAGPAIPLSGRLCSVVDVFDALTSVRPYKEAWPIEKSVDAIVAGAGTQFDPITVATFQGAFDEMLAIKRKFSDARLNAGSLGTWPIPHASLPIPAFAM